MTDSKTENVRPRAGRSRFAPSQRWLTNDVKTTHQRLSGHPATDEQPTEGAAPLLLLFGTLLLPLREEFNVVRLLLVVYVFLRTPGQSAPARWRWFPGTFFLFTNTALLLGASNSLIRHGVLSIEELQHEAVRFAYYSIFMQCALRQKAPTSVLITLAKALLTLHISIQVLQLMGFAPLNVWIAEHYATSTIHLELSTYAWPDFRSGSIYLNPNVYVIFAVIFLIVFLQGWRLSALKRPLLWTLICLVSIILTGSRMGFVLTLVVLIAAWARLGEPSKRRPAALLGSVLAVWAFVAFRPALTEIGANSRSLDISGGLTDSISVKIRLLLEALTRMHPSDLIFGTIGTSVSATQDMELAHILVLFGLLGLVWYVSLLIFMVSASRDHLPLTSKLIGIFIPLASLAASTVLNMAVFPFILLVTLVHWHPGGATTQTVAGSQRPHVKGERYLAIRSSEGR